MGSVAEQERGFVPATKESRETREMRKVARLAAVVFVVGALGSLGWARGAYASPLEIEGGGSFGYGTNPSHGPNPLALSFSVRAGLDYNRLYAGIAGTYSFGSSGNCLGDAAIGGGAPSLPARFCTPNGEVSIRQSSVLYGADLGYTLSFPGASFLKVRPLLELGDFVLTRSGNVGTSGIMGGTLSSYQSTDAFYLQPGAELLFGMNGFFFGVDANLLLVPSVLDIDSAVIGQSQTMGSLTATRDAFVAFTSHVQIGFRF
jgi:hypothetical protein